MAKKIGEAPTRRSYIKSYEDQKKEELVALGQSRQSWNSILKDYNVY